MSIKLVLCKSKVKNITMKLLVALGILVFVVSADAGVSMNNPFYCYTLDPIRSSVTMHSGVTSYEAIRHINFTTVNPYISICTPSRFWYIGNYGSRMPRAVEIPRMIEFTESSIQADIVRNYDAGRTTLCRQDFEAIRDWTINPSFNIENAEVTTEAGEIGMQNIGRRYQQRFPNILTETYSLQRFFFRHTDNQRSNTTIRAFATGIFGESESQNVIYEDVPEFDWFLRPLEFCPAYDEERDDDEIESFRRGPEIEQMLEEINSRLGFRGSNQLSLETINTMWGWCSYETMATFELSNSEIGPDSPWCAPFTIAHHSLLEYGSCLTTFYSYGYGFRNQRLRANLNCGLVQDLINHMQSDDVTDQVARIFVSRYTEVLLMLMSLGSYREVWRPHRHNFAQQSARQWRSSFMRPMAANVVVVRYDCDDGDHDLIFLLNEKPLLVPGCDQQTGVCKLNFIVTMLQRFIGADCETLFCSNE